jgi:hypothetical protein
VAGIGRRDSEKEKEAGSEEGKVHGGANGREGLPEGRRAEEDGEGGSSTLTRPPRRTASVLVAGLFVALVAAVAIGRGPGDGSLVVPPAPVDEGAVAVERLVMNMSLEVKAGQLLMTGFHGTRS